MLFLLIQVLKGKILENISSKMLRRNRNRNYTKVVCHYCNEKEHIMPLCHVTNIEVYNVIMTWVPKDLITNPQGS